MLLSVSDLELHVECPQKFHNQHTHGRGTKKLNESFGFGTVVHAALAERLLRPEDTGLAAEEAGNQVLFDLTQDYPEDRAVWLKIDRLWQIYKPYVIMWKPPSTWEVLSVEQELRAPLGSHTLVGRLDAIVRTLGGMTTKYYEHWHNQHKTLAPTIPLHAYGDVIRTSWHEIAYQYLVKHNMGINLAGTQLNVLKKLSQKLLAEGENPFSLQELGRSEAVYKKGLFDMEQRMNKIEHEMIHPELIEQTRKSCGGPNRNSLCQYKMVCDGLVRLDSDLFVEIERRYT